MTKLRDIYDQSRGKCGRCGEKKRWGYHGITWHKGHIKAKALGGSDYLTNLQVECIKCNLSAGADHQGYKICKAIKDIDDKPCTAPVMERSSYCGRHQSWRR